MESLSILTDKERSLRANNFTKIIALFLAVGVSVQLFQNCSAVMSPEDEGSYSSRFPSTGLSTPTDHPNDAVVKPTSQRPVLANREYIFQLFSEVFETPQTANSASSTIKAWVGNHSGIFGYPCNPKGPNGVGDCGGSDLAPMNPQSDTLRASHKAQLCLTLTSNQTFLQNALSKIDNRPAQPDLQSIHQIIKLFYRGEEDMLGLANELLVFDQSVKETDPMITTIDRWRLLVNMVCESPNWELL